MPPQGENKEFSRWLEQWMARIQQAAFHDHEPPPKETSGREQQPPEQPITKPDRKAA